MTVPQPRLDVAFAEAMGPKDEFLYDCSKLVGFVEGRFVI